MIAKSSTVKLGGYPLAFGMPLLAPLGVWLDMPWLAPLVVFGVLPVLGLVIGEDHSLPIVGLRRSSGLVRYLDFLPRVYAAIWVATLAWAAAYVTQTELGAGSLAWLIVSVVSEARWRFVRRTS